MIFVPKFSETEELILDNIKISLFSEEVKSKNKKFYQEYIKNQIELTTQAQLYFSVEIEENSQRKLIGIISAFRRNSRDYFGNSCIFQFLVKPEYKTDKNISSILMLVNKHFFRIFKVATVFIAKENFQEYKNILEQNNFKRTERFFINKNVEFWESSAVKQKYSIIPFTNNIFHITDGTGVFCTLVEGTKSSLLIDTLWGVSALPELISKINDKPYKVVNTHCHPDHAFGNLQFEKVFIPKDDEIVYKEINQYDSSREENFADEEDIRLYKNLKFPPIEYINENEEINLGELTVQIVSLRGHTLGSLGYLVKEEKILIAGDAISNNLWFFLKESLSIKEMLPIYKKANQLDFEKVVSSHSKVMWNKNILDTIIANLEQILAGTYFYDSSTNAEIEGYKTTQITYSDQNYDSVILIRITSE